MNDKAIILAVDDSHESLALLDKILSQAGYQVRPTDSSELTLAAVTANPPDLILLDVRMQGIGGLETCRRLKAVEATRHIPIILMSASAEAKEWLPGLELGAADYITKPFQPEELLARVKAHLTLSRANEQLQAEIAQRQKLEEELSEREDTFKHIFDFSVTGISTTLPSGEINVNRAFCRMLGYSQEELKNIKWQDISHPDDIEYTQNMIQSLLSGEKETVRFSKRFLHKNGSVVWADVGSTLRRDRDGKPQYFVTTINDITGRKRAEDDLASQHALLTALINSPSDIIIFSLDTEYCYTAFNEKHREEMKRVWSADISVGMKILDCIKVQDLRELAKQSIDHALRGESFSETQHQPGINVYYELSWAPIFRNADVVGATVFIRDISERRKAEEERRLFTEELARSNVDLQQFAYVASHDLQEPLRMISSYLQLIERRYKDKLDDDANTFIYYAVDGATRMQALISGLLEFSRIKTHGKVFAKVDVTAVLQGVCQNLESMIVQSGAAVRYDDMPIIRADESQIARLFQNLIQNAIKFRREGVSPTIEITAEKADGGQVFCVHDNGIGIEKQYFERIFTIFQRLHTREQYPGTGIGLSICKRIVERHHGSI